MDDTPDGFPSLADLTRAMAAGDDRAWQHFHRVYGPPLFRHLLGQRPGDVLDRYRLALIRLRADHPQPQLREPPRQRFEDRLQPLQVAEVVRMPDPAEG